MKSFYEIDTNKTNYVEFDLLSDTSMYPSFHNAIEFVYCVEGVLSTVINGEKRLLQKDEMYALPTPCIHSHKQLKGNKIYVLVFSPNYYEDFEKSFPEKTFDVFLTDKQRNREIYALLTEIYQLFNQYQFNYNAIPYLERQAIINHFLYKLTTIYPLHNVSRKKNDDYFLSILQFINTHYKENLTLENLASRFNYNKKYFSDLFNSKMGCNLKSYINNLRIETALTQINNPKNTKTTTQIALDSGFSSLASFYRVMKISKTK